MTRDEAQRLLSLTDIECGSAQSVRSAWAQQVRECHSDTAATGTDDAQRLAMLTHARDILLEQRVAPISRCNQCQGRGMLKALKGRIGLVTCPVCKGTGDKQ